MLTNKHLVLWEVTQSMVSVRGAEERLSKGHQKTTLCGSSATAFTSLAEDEHHLSF